MALEQGETHRLTCPECGAAMVARWTPKFKTRDGQNRRFWGCSRWPECNATHGAHPDGSPMGIPADKETKALRRQAHIEAERVWGKWSEMSKANRVFMYEWMRLHTTSGDIGMMLTDELLDTIEKLKQLPPQP